MNIYVGNLNYKSTEDQVRQLFSEFGVITSIKLIKDFNGQSRGFAFVEFEDNNAGQEAIGKLNGYMFMDKTLQVNEARPKTPGGGRNGGGGYQGNRSGGGGYGGDRSGGGGYGGDRSGGGYGGERRDRDFDRGGDRKDRDFDRGGDRRDYNRNDRDGFDRGDKKDFRKRY